MTDAEFLFSVLTAGVGERLNLTQDYSQRPQAKTLVNHLLIVWRQILREKADLKNRSQLMGKKVLSKTKSLSFKQVHQAIVNTEKIRLMIEGNVNPRLALESLFLSYPQITAPSKKP
jgi:hypothetical protein